MDLSNTNVNSIFLFITAAWAGTLTYVWFRHVALDDERYERVENRLSEMVKELKALIKEIHEYQTDFNLRVATDISEIKAYVGRLAVRGKVKKSTWDNDDEQP